MNGILSDLIQSFEQCLRMVGGNGDHFDSDAALAMTFILMERKILNEQDRSILCMNLAEKCLNCPNMFSNITEQAEFLERASFYPNTVRYLIKYRVFNISTLHSVLDNLNHEVRYGGGVSSMSACMSYIQSKAESAVIIQDCINLIDTNKAFKRYS